MDPLLVVAIGAVGVVVSLLIAIAASEDYEVTLRRTILIALCMTALVLLVYLALDMRELRHHLPTEPKLFVLKEGERMIAAFMANGTDEVHPVADMNPIRDGARRDGIAGVHNASFYRTFFVDRAATENPVRSKFPQDNHQAYTEQPLTISDSIIGGDAAIELLNITIPRDTAIAYLYMAEPGDAFIDLYARTIGISSDYRYMVASQFREIVPTDDYFRSVIFAKLSEPHLRGTRWLTTYHYGHLQGYPNSITLVMVRIMPLWFASIIMPEG